MRRKTENPAVPVPRGDLERLEARIDAGFDRLVTTLAATVKLLQKELRRRGK